MSTLTCTKEAHICCSDLHNTHQNIRIKNLQQPYHRSVSPCTSSHPSNLELQSSPLQTYKQLLFFQRFAFVIVSVQKKPQKAHTIKKLSNKPECLPVDWVLHKSDKFDVEVEHSRVMTAAIAYWCNISQFKHSIWLSSLTCLANACLKEAWMIKTITALLEFQPGPPAIPSHKPETSLSVDWIL